jgi:hypothetical protein
METPDFFTFPGYVHVPELGHDIFGSESFFFSKEKLQEATLSPFSIPSFQYRQHPEHYKTIGYRNLLSAHVCCCNC